MSKGKNKDFFICWIGLSVMLFFIYNDLAPTCHVLLDILNAICAGGNVGFYFIYKELTEKK